ncbi:MAG: hypothetical protein M9894_11480 [Planctomycetes bacterium]|nr:hypothetical protein [Planctomycetota bacterium]
MDTSLARLARALGALDDPAVAAALESALLRAGRLEEAYLLRWRRGEPSPVAAAVAERQRPALAALDADPAVHVGSCEVCVALGWHPEARLHVGSGARDALGWAPLGSHLALPDEPIVAAEGIERPEELTALASLGTLVEAEVTSGALAAPLPPTIEALRVRVTEGRLPPDRLAGLDRLRALEVRGRVTDEGLEQTLTACGGRLERLSLHADLLTDGGLEALARAPRLRDLALLSAPWLDGSGLRALVEVGAPLERFTLASAPRSTWRTLDALESLSTVEEVRLRGLALEGDGLAPLAGLPRLRRLDLTRVDAAPDAFEALADAPIEDLEVVGVPGVDDAAIANIAALPALRRVHAFELERPTGRGWAALGRAHRLERLALLDCVVDAEALLGLSRAASLLELTLDTRTEPPAAGVGTALARFASSTRLSLHGTFASPAVLDELAGAASTVSALELRPRTVRASRDLLASVARLKQLEQLALVGHVEPGALGVLTPALELRDLTLSTSAAALDADDIAALRGCISLCRLTIWCDEPTRERLTDALPGVEVLPFDAPSWRGSPGRRG